MIVTTKFLSPTATRGARLRVASGPWSITLDYYALVAQGGSSEADRNAVQAFLATLGIDLVGPVLVEAGEEPHGDRFVVLNGPLSLAAAVDTEVRLGLLPGSILSPQRAATPCEMYPGQRVRHATLPDRLGSVVRRHGRSTSYLVAWDGKSHPSTVSRGNLSEALA